ncbi:MAG: ATP-binding cassette domain-containing protein, partial [Clostridia bacterium]
VQTQMFESLERIGVKGKIAKTQIAMEALKKVGLENASEILNMYPFMLSGGMAQRVVIAIASVSSPTLVIADELTKGIDGKTADAIVDTLEKTFSNAAIIIITHDISLARKCDKTLVMYGGKIVEFGNSSEILKNPTHFYTKSLIDALPQNGLKIAEKINTYPENGCPFVNYCENATVECSKQPPQLIEVDGKKVRCQNA